MTDTRLVTALGEMDDMWAAALKEKGFRVLSTKDGAEAAQSGADFLLVDGRQKDSLSKMESIRSSTKCPILSLIETSISREDLKDLKSKGASGYLSVNTPSEEVALRIQAMLEPKAEAKTGESRSSRRVWFQQEVNFKIFDKSHKAWSTTLSETGIFIRTPLSFPLYTVLHLNFSLYGESEEFKCDGVIVRQEVDSDVKGLGVMFQNLKGESIRRLESFFEAYS